MDGLPIMYYELGKLEMIGYLDEAGDEKIKIVFEKPYMIMSTFMFTYEGSGDFVSLVTGDEAKEINIKYGVEQGNRIFKISNTNIGSSMYIIAQEMDFKIIGN